MSQDVSEPEKKLPYWAKAFLAVFAECGIIKKAARAARRSRRQVNRLLVASPLFAELFELAKEDAADTLIDEAIRRGRDGYDEPVIYQGELCGVWVDEYGDMSPESQPGYTFRPLTVRKFSDTLLIKTVQWLKPELREGKVEITGKDGGPIRTENKNDGPIPITAEQRLAEAVALLEAARSRADKDTPGSEADAVHP